MVGDTRTGFVVLPDSAAGVGVANRLLPWGTTLAEYRSGRPMIVGNCRDRPVRQHIGNGVRTVLLGYALVDDEVLAEHAMSNGSAEGWRDLLGVVDGCFHSVVNIGSETYVNGSDYGACALYLARFEGVSVAADTIHPLRHLVDGKLDVDALAAHLCEPVPHHLAQRPLIRGIEPLYPGSGVAIRADGVSRLLSGRRRLLTVQDRGEPASNVRARLTGAVAARTAAGGVITSELSGGYDSTAISFFASQGPAQLTMVTAQGGDSANEDLEWALRAAGHLPAVKHSILPADALPLTYAGLGDGPTWLNEPSLLIVGRRRVGALGELAATVGSRVHLTGHGGDHLFGGVPTLYRDLVWKRPLTAWRGLRDFGALGGWKLRDTVTSACNLRGFRSWWIKNSRPTVGVLAERQPILGWAIPPSVPPWTTEEALRKIQDGILWMASATQPSAPERGRNLELESVLEGARTSAVLNRISLASGGPPLATPYFDDGVISAALSVAVERRVSPWTYKPLLRAAVEGIVPDEIVQRQTKDDGTHDVELGLRKHRDELVSLWEDSRLGDLGLIDAPMLKNLSANPSSFELEEGAMYSTIACELWLRDLEYDFVGKSE